MARSGLLLPLVGLVAACSPGPATMDMEIPSGTKLIEGACPAQLMNARCYFTTPPGDFY